MKLENDFFRLEVSEQTGAITSLVPKLLGSDLIGESRLEANFRIGLPYEGRECNFIDGMRQRAEVSRSADTVCVHFAELTSSEGGTYPIELEYTIALEAETIRFRSRLTNHSPHPVSEFWFPRLGGWTQFGESRDAKGAVPGYTNCGQYSFFKELPWTQALGAEASEWHGDYPGGFIMPWLDLYDEAKDAGLYLGYHDPVCRNSTWHLALHPRDGAGGWIEAEDAAGEPVGLIFSHVRYPFISNGETFESGEFILRVHAGDWHEGSKFYGAWFREHFPFDKSQSWLRKKSAWFSSIIYQPEDKLLANYEGFDQWCREAEEFGVDTFELVGWDKGGLERDYPDYVPEERLGGREGFRRLLHSIDERGKKCLVFVNYNVLDQSTDWFKKELHAYTHHDLFGSTPNWMSWGQSTFLARKGYARKHLLSSIIPPMEKILEDRFLEIVKDGAHGFQIDKLCIATCLDFNPLNPAKPDVAMCENLIQAIARMLAKCREINPAFCLAAEAMQDRLIPYLDVFYRCASGYTITPLRYVFPEITACQHISAPFDFRGVNGALLTGAVIVVEPLMYQGSLGLPLYQKLGSYIQEIERIRHELADLIFLGDYHDTHGASVRKTDSAPGVARARQVGGEVMLPGGAAPAAVLSDLPWRVHGDPRTGRRAIVVANDSNAPIEYRWEFLHRSVPEALLYEPFQPVRRVAAGEALSLPGASVQVLVEPEH